MACHQFCHHRPMKVMVMAITFYRGPRKCHHLPSQTELAAEPAPERRACGSDLGAGNTCCKPKPPRILNALTATYDAHVSRPYAAPCRRATRGAGNPRHGQQKG